MGGHCCARGLGFVHEARRRWLHAVKIFPGGEGWAGVGASDASQEESRQFRPEEENRCFGGGRGDRACAQGGAEEEGGGGKCR